MVTVRRRWNIDSGDVSERRRAVTPPLLSMYLAFSSTSNENKIRNCRLDAFVCRLVCLTTLSYFSKRFAPYPPSFAAAAAPLPTFPSLQQTVSSGNDNALWPLSH